MPECRWLIPYLPWRRRPAVPVCYLPNLWAVCRRSADGGLGTIRAAPTEALYGAVWWIRPPVMPSTTGCLYGFRAPQVLPARMSLNSVRGWASDGRRYSDGALRASGPPSCGTGRVFQARISRGKIDLTEAEAIADLIDADTDAQRRQALAQLGGGLSQRLEALAAKLIDILAHTEAWIDFPDEDLPADVESAARAGIYELESDISAFLDDNRRGERLRDGLQVAILGAPNAGKSSLLVTLAARDAAIVSDIAGTTRDVIEVHLDLGGWPVTLADTAGLRDAGDLVEQEGVKRALGRAVDTDLCLVLFDATVFPIKANPENCWIGQMPWPLSPRQILKAA